MDGVIRLQGVENFRDFGGFAGAQGYWVKRGRLFRSASPAHATESDVAALGAIPIQTVIDLRRATERREAPSRLGPRLGAETIESDEGDRGVGPHVEFLRRGDVSALAVETYLTDYYENAFFELRHQSLFARAFSALDGREGAVLIHCAAGKDRTGLLAALIRHALGAQWDETVADFAESNRHAMTPTKLAAAEDRLTALLGRPPGETALKAFLGVWPHHLETAFSALRTRCGSVDAYLDGLGVDAARRWRLAQTLSE